MQQERLEVGLELSLASDITGGAVEGSSEGQEVSEGHRDGGESPLLEGLDGVGLVSLHHNTFLEGEGNIRTVVSHRKKSTYMIQHDDVA